MPASSSQSAERRSPHLWSIAIFVLASSILTAPASGSAAERKPTPNPIQLATALAQGIDDKNFRAQFLAALIEFQIDRKALNEATALALTIPDYRRGIALARVAAAFGRAGQKAESARVLERVELEKEFALPWQAERVRAEAAVAWAAAGQAEKALGLSEQLTDEAARIRARSGTALEKARRAQPYDATAFDFPATVTQPAPERLPAVQALMEICAARLSGQKTRPAAKDPAALCEKAEAILKGSRVAAGEEYLDLAFLWRRLGRPEKSAELIGEALRQMPAGTELQNWRAGYFARLVDAYAEGGNDDAVARMLEAAERGLARLHPFDQVPAFCQLAEAQIAAGLSVEAEKTWLEAARVAEKNPNPGSQYLGLAQVAFSIARAGVRMPGELNEMLAARASDAKSGGASLVRQ